MTAGCVCTWLDGPLDSVPFLAQPNEACTIHHEEAVAYSESDRVTLPLELPVPAGEEDLRAPVLGLDLSLTSTGWATPTATGVIKPKATLRGIDRLRWITTQVGLTILASSDARLPLVAIEGPSYGSVGPGQHERGGLWWHTVDYLDDHGLRVVIVPPATLKKFACGKGNAGKDEVLLAAARRFDWFTGGNDEADALWLAAIAAELLGQPLVTMPAANRVDLASKVTWIREPVAA